MDKETNEYISERIKLMNNLFKIPKLAALKMNPWINPGLIIFSNFS